MLKYFIALMALSISFHASAVDTVVPPNKVPQTLPPQTVEQPLPGSFSGGSGGGGGSSADGPSGGIGSTPKPINTLPPVQADPPIVKSPEPPKPAPVDPPVVNQPAPVPPIVKQPEPPPVMPPPRPIVEPPIQSSCGYMKNRQNLRSDSASSIQALISQRNMDFDLLRGAQNRTYELLMRASRTLDPSMQSSIQKEIACFKEVAASAQANFNADSDAIAKLLNAPIPPVVVTEPKRPPIVSTQPVPLDTARQPASTAPVAPKFNVAN